VCFVGILYGQGVKGGGQLLAGVGPSPEDGTQGARIIAQKNLAVWTRRSLTHDTSGNSAGKNSPKKGIPSNLSRGLIRLQRKRARPSS